MHKTKLKQAESEINNANIQLIMLKINKKVFRSHAFNSFWANCCFTDSLSSLPRCTELKNDEEKFTISTVVGEVEVEAEKATDNISDL